VHQLDILKLMLLNRRFGSNAPSQTRATLKAA